MALNRKVHRADHRRSRSQKSHERSYFGRRQPVTVGKDKSYLVSHEHYKEELTLRLKEAEVVLCEELLAPGAIHRHGQLVKFFADDVKMPYRMAFLDMLRESLGKRILVVVGSNRHGNKR